MKGANKQFLNMSHHLSNTEAMSEVVIRSVVVAEVHLKQKRLQSWQLK